MNGAPTAEDVIGMLREEGIVELPADFPVHGDLFAEGMDSMAVMQLIVVVEDLARLIARKSGGAA